MTGQNVVAVATQSANAGSSEENVAVAQADTDTIVSPFSAVPFPTDSKLLSTVAHELRTPLTALVTSAELLVEDFDRLPAEQMREMVSMMHRGALWLHGLVENLLCAATIKEERLQIHPRPITLVDVVTEVDPVVAPLLTQKDQRLRVRTHGHIPEIDGDPRRLGQVLINLILNASKYADPHTDIDLDLRLAGDSVRIDVADRGPGVDEELMARIFEPFYRTAPASRSGKEGVGLGLSIVRSIVEAHKGRVGVVNRPGGGACFWFELPTKWAIAPHDLLDQSGGAY